LSDTFTKLHLEDDNLHVETKQDVQPILDLNKADRNANSSRFRRSEEMEHVARIPMVVVEDWINRFGINAMAPSEEDTIRITALLNSPDYAYLKTRNMKL
jgi:hypothetical protein